MKSFNKFQKLFLVAIVGIGMISFQNCSQAKFSDAAASMNLVKNGVISCPELILNGDFENVREDLSGEKFLGLHNNILLSSLAFPQWDLYSSIPSWAPSELQGPGGYIEVQAGTTNKAYSGEKYVELDRYPQPDGRGGIFQRLRLTSGDYLLSYHYIARPGDPNSAVLTLFLDYNIVSTQSVEPVDSEWKEKLVPLHIASDGLYRLGIKAQGVSNGTGPQLDKISLKQDCNNTAK